MTPIKAAADPSREFVEELRKYWSFDNDQMHTHSWHDRENFIARKLPSLLAKFAPAGNAGVRAWLIERDGEWYGPPCSRYIWQRAIAPPSLWTSDANKAWRFARREDAEAYIEFEGFQKAAATEHIWVDAAPPEASFDNASDMLGYLNAPREAEPMAPAGWKLVPERPNRWQMDAGLYQSCADATYQDVWSIYADMIAVAPKVDEYEPAAFPSPIPEVPGARDEIIEQCARICSRIAVNAERRAADHTNIDAKRAALDKCQAAQECEQAIRALKLQDGGNCEHGIAKVNCGICIPSEVFSKPQDGGESGR